MAGRTASRAVEVRLSGFNISRLKIGHIHTFSLAALRHALDLLGVDECCEFGDLFTGEIIESRHSLVGPSVQHDIGDLVSPHIRAHQLGSSEVGASFSAARVPPVTKGAVLLEEGTAGGS